MLFFKLMSLVAYGALPVIARHVSTTTTSAAPITVPTPTYLFTAFLRVGKPLEPIPLLEGGAVIIEPLINGTITGPDLNATVHGGFAAAMVVANNTITGKGKTVQIPSIYVYGETNDGLPFYVQESGVGPQAGQNTRLVIAVGGEYSNLQELFILGQPTINQARTVVTVPCFSVPLPPGI
ncbi:hypothetical protein FZEAL_4565 [Fusarium zealandicum]|uniref:Uncharacterized protein n=1 Tax=Fusarium zealandicum TaxID=1053134 RepID=A0A8H4ULH0_9HYPO|nr:hypothetical protein FZEAL_4565 [Fusarium zealandicum]